MCWAAVLCGSLGSNAEIRRGILFFKINRFVDCSTADPVEVSVCGRQLHEPLYTHKGHDEWIAVAPPRRGSVWMRRNPDHRRCVCRREYEVAIGRQMCRLDNVALAYLPPCSRPRQQHRLAPPPLTHHPPSGGIAVLELTAPKTTASLPVIAGEKCTCRTIIR